MVIYIQNTHISIILISSSTITKVVDSKYSISILLLGHCFLLL